MRDARHVLSNRHARWLRGGVLAGLLVAAPLGAQTPDFTPDRSVEWAGLRFDYALEPHRTDRIVLTATVTNTTDRSIALRLPWCLAWLQVYRDGRRMWDRGEVEDCDEMVRFVDLEPGESERDRHAVHARDLPGMGTGPSAVEIRAYFPTHHVPWLPPRAARDVRFGSVAVAVGSSPADESELPGFGRVLGIPGVPWGSPAEMVQDSLTDRGFRTAGSDPNGSVLFNGHDFLGRNAGIIARFDDGHLVKLVALMELRTPGGDAVAELRELRATLARFYGPPDRRTDGSAPTAVWRRWSPEGLHQARLTITPENHLRLDLEPPAWEHRFREARGRSASESAQIDGSGGGR
jgi:hypothetical protein